MSASYVRVAPAKMQGRRGGTMNTIQRAFAAVLLSAATAGFALGGLACDRQEGPFEEAGESIDDAADEAEDAVDDAGR
jgi:hypothetical protein